MFVTNGRGSLMLSNLYVQLAKLWPRQSSQFICSSMFMFQAKMAGQWLYLDVSITLHNYAIFNNIFAKIELLPVYCYRYVARKYCLTTQLDDRGDNNVNHHF